MTDPMTPEEKMVARVKELEADRDKWRDAAIKAADIIKEGMHLMPLNQLRTWSGCRGYVELIGQEVDAPTEPEPDVPFAEALELLFIFALHSITIPDDAPLDLVIHEAGGMSLTYGCLVLARDFVDKHRQTILTDDYQWAGSPQRGGVKGWT